MLHQTIRQGTDKEKVKAVGEGGAGSDLPSVGGTARVKAPGHTFEELWGGVTLRCGLVGVAP